MLRPSAFRISNQAIRNTARQATAKPIKHSTRIPSSQHSITSSYSNRQASARITSLLLPGSRSFQTSSVRSSILPDAENPPPRESEAQETSKTPTEISYEEFHELADRYLEELVNKLEQLQETKGDLEVEYAAGVLSIEVPSKGNYVLNKQPPNKQIWLSSPISGPKRFDWMVTGESMHQKEGGGSGNWVYLRDGTSLTSLVRKELGIELGMDPETT